MHILTNNRQHSIGWHDFWKSLLIILISFFLPQCECWKVQCKPSCQRILRMFENVLKCKKVKTLFLFQMQNNKNIKLWLSFSCFGTKLHAFKINVIKRAFEFPGQKILCIYFHHWCYLLKMVLGYVCQKVNKWTGLFKYNQ